MAAEVLAEDSSSPELRRLAADFTERLAADTLD